MKRRLILLFALLPLCASACEGGHAQPPQVAYLDIFAPMLGKDGKLQVKGFMHDGPHMNRAGYALWVGTVRPWVDAHGH